MLSSSLFITGTDTGVGKTLCACLIAAAARRLERRVGALKPVETGWREGSAEQHDALLLKEASGSDLPLEQICPYRFPDPLAPLAAARRVQREISLSRIAGAYRQVARHTDIVIVEGAGGLMVPLTPKATFADLALALDLPVLVVVGSRLGAVNHTLMTIEVARHKGLKVCGYVINHPWPPTSLAVEDNPRTIGEFAGVPCIGQLPYLDAAAGLELQWNSLADLAFKHLDLSQLPGRGAAAIARGR